MSVYFVYLRRPDNLGDRRNDPFWEFGSFGRTGCHETNLLHPKNCRIRDGDRLAFLQGVYGEVRVVGLTPAVKVAGTNAQIELKWDKTYRPVPLKSAPLLINNSGETAFPSVYSALRLDDTNGATFCSRAASRLRSRSSEISHELAQEITKWFAKPRLPRIIRYMQAIESESGLWYRRAIANNWASAAERASQYKHPKVNGRVGCKKSASQKPISTKGKRGC